MERRRQGVGLDVWYSGKGQGEKENGCVEVVERVDGWGGGFGGR